MAKPTGSKSKAKNEITKGQMTLSFSKGKMGIENSNVNSQSEKNQSQIEVKKEEFRDVVKENVEDKIERK